MKSLKIFTYASVIAIMLVMLSEIFRIGKMVNKLNDRIYTLELEITSNVYTGRVGERVK